MRHLFTRTGRHHVVVYCAHIPLSTVYTVAWCLPIVCCHEARAYEGKRLPRAVLGVWPSKVPPWLAGTQVLQHAQGIMTITRCIPSCGWRDTCDSFAHLFRRIASRTQSRLDCGCDFHLLVAPSDLYKAGPGANGLQPRGKSKGWA